MPPEIDIIWPNIQSMQALKSGSQDLTLSEEVEPLGLIVKTKLQSFWWFLGDHTLSFSVVGENDKNVDHFTYLSSDIHNGISGESEVLKGCVWAGAVMNSLGKCTWVLSISEQEDKGFFRPLVLPVLLYSCELGQCLVPWEAAWIPLVPGCFVGL